MGRDSITRTGARTPGAEDYPSSTAVHYRAHGPAQYGIADVGHEMHEGRRQTGRRSAHAGSRLKLIDVREGPAWKASLPAVSGKTRRTEVATCKTGVFSRRQTCQGKSQEPCSLDGRMAGVSKIPKVLKPIDKVSLGEITSHRAVTTVNAMWPRKV